MQIHQGTKRLNISYLYSWIKANPRLLDKLLLQSRNEPLSQGKQLRKIFFWGGLSFIDSNKQAVIYKAKTLKQIQINSKGQP